MTASRRTMAPYDVEPPTLSILFSKLRVPQPWTGAEMCRTRGNDAPDSVKLYCIESVENCGRISDSLTRTETSFR